MPSTEADAPVAEGLLSADLEAAAAPAAPLAGDGLFAYGDYAPLAFDLELAGSGGIALAAPTGDIALTAMEPLSIGALAGGMAELQVLGQGGFADGAAATLAAYAVQPLSADLSLSGALLPESLLG